MLLKNLYKNSRWTLQKKVRFQDAQHERSRRSSKISVPINLKNVSTELFPDRFSPLLEWYSRIRLKDLDPREKVLRKNLILCSGSGSSFLRDKT
jgi:hypothetical protein